MFRTNVDGVTGIKMETLITRNFMIAEHETHVPVVAVFLWLAC
jgi:hypothetical protein